MFLNRVKLLFRKALKNVRCLDILQNSTSLHYLRPHLVCQAAQNAISLALAAIYLDTFVGFALLFNTFAHGEQTDLLEFRVAGT